MGERGRLGRLAVGLATLAFGVEAAVVGGIFAARYSGRKHRPAATFPVLAPVEADAAGDDITVYTFGADLYADMLAAISGAQEVIYFETFIWKGDEVGQKFKDALIAAAERGVKVYITYDTFANLVVRPAFFQFPPSVMVRRHPLFGGGGLHMLDPRNAGRDHRKILVIDHTRGFVGGLQHRRPVRAVLARHARRSPWSGGRRARLRLSSTTGMPAPAGTAPCCRSPHVPGSHGSRSIGTCRATWSTRSATCTSKRSIGRRAT